MASKNNIEIIKEKYQIARTSRKPIDTIIGFLISAVEKNYPAGEKLENYDNPTILYTSIEDFKSFNTSNDIEVYRYN